MKEKREKKEQCRNKKSIKAGILYLSFVLFQIIGLGKFLLFSYYLVLLLIYDKTCFLNFINLIKSFKKIDYGLKQQKN